MVWVVRAHKARELDILDTNNDLRNFKNKIWLCIITTQPLFQSDVLFEAKRDSYWLTCMAESDRKDEKLNCSTFKHNFLFYQLPP
jgi:hypothetical protein